MGRKKVNFDKQIDEALESISDEAREIIKEMEETKGMKLVNITKLKCDYNTYKTQREQHKMKYATKCAKCNKEFTENDELYQAEAENQRQVIICKNCAK